MKNETPNKRTKAILYARVASINLNQKPERLQFQLDCMTVYCQDNGIEIVNAIAEVASGVNFERHKFIAALEKIKEGSLKADLLLFTKWDRFTRDILFTGKKMVAELESLGIKPMAINDKTGSEAILKIATTLK